MMKKTIFTNWTFIRFLRLGMGIAIIVQALIAKDILFGFMGLLLTALPVFNIGCCGTQGCYVPPTKSGDNTKDITYEEVV